MAKTKQLASLLRTNVRAEPLSVGRILTRFLRPSGLQLVELPETAFTPGNPIDLVLPNEAKA